MPFDVLKIMFNVIMLGTLLACSEPDQPVAEVSPTRLVRTLTVGGEAKPPIRGGRVSVNPGAGPRGKCQVN